MVKGFGTDIVEILRIQNLIDKYNSHFIQKVYTDLEIEYCEKYAKPAIHYAGRWAAKEAFYKALPDKSQKYAFWKSIEILQEGQTSGKPKIIICSDLLKHSLESEDITNIIISISHEQKYCIASVLLE